MKDLGLPLDEGARGNRSRNAFALFAMVAFAAACVSVVAWRIWTSDELRSKHEWSVLQNLEVRHRSSRENLIIQTPERHCAIGVLSENRERRAWILLGGESIPVIKELDPPTAFSLSFVEHSRILRTCDLNAAALDFLAQRFTAVRSRNGQ